jgi:hypothetical protein
MNFLNIKTVAAALLGSAVTFGSIYTTKSEAQSAGTLFTGSCGGILNISSTYDVLKEYIQNSIDTEGGNALAEINFDTKKISFNVSEVSLLDSNTNTAGRFGKDGGYNESNASTSGLIKKWESRIIGPADFSITPVNGLNNAYEMTVTVEGRQRSILIMPVNGGNTYLIQGKNFFASGVCQKF